MARLYKTHRRTGATIDVVLNAAVSTGRKNGWITVNIWAVESADHHISLTNEEALELIANLAKAIKP